MSGAIDDEVVRMRFDNSAFARGVSSTLSMLDKLKKSLSFSGADKGLTDLENKANKLDMSGMNKQIDDSAHHWSAWRSAGLIAFATVVHKAVIAGINVVKAFTIDPVTAGFKNYETQINAVQTILANTGLKGSKGLAQVNSVLKELNTYANQTVYNFSDMAKNIGTFTAAGVKLKPATESIKGIANLAALSGSTSEQASTAMYQLSQAIAANQVKLQDWNSVVNAGMGGKVFQQALFNVGKMEHTLKGVKANETFDQWTKAGNSFRNSLQKGWITGKVLTDTLQQFTGDLTDAQLKAQGYNKAQIKQIQELAKTAVGAATKIKTLTQLKDALKEEVATAYGAIFKTIFGDINGATALFSSLHTVIENALTVPIYALNTLLEGVVKLGGRTALIDAFKLAFQALGNVIKPIKEAFREIFPPVTAKRIFDLIKSFHVFAENLNPLPGTVDAIKRVFLGLFAMFDIAKQVIGGVAHVFVDLIKSMGLGGAGSSLLYWLANMGTLVVDFDRALKKGNAFATFFQRIGGILAVPIAILKQFAGTIAHLFTGFGPGDATGVTSGLDKVNKKLLNLQTIMEHVQSFFAALDSKIKPAIQTVIHAFGELGSAIAKGLNSQAFGNILKALQVGLLGGIVVMLRKFFSKGINVDVGGGIFGQIRETLEGVTGTLKSMQTQLKAKTLLEIASALGILAIAMVALAGVNSEKLSSALKAMAVGFGELLASMAILTKITSGAGLVKLPLAAAAMNLLAGALLVLAGAVKILASMSWEELKKGLSAVGALLAELTVSALLISKNSGNLISAGVGITAMAVALNILAIAVKQFAKMSWKDIAKGLAAVAGALVAIAIGIKLMPTQAMISTGIGLLAISAALNAIYLAVKSFSSLSWKEMAKGLVGVAGALVGIAIAMNLMPKGMILQAAGLAAIAGSLILIEKVMVSMAKLSWGTIGKGIGTIAIALGVLAGAMIIMEGAALGAAALAIVAGSLSLLMPVIKDMGKQSWGTIGKGLLVFAASLVILLAAGAGAEVVALGLAVLAAAALAIGAGMALAGAGVLALGTGLSLLASAGAAAIAVLAGVLVTIISQIPALAVAFAQGLIDVLTIIGKNGPAIIAAFSTILSSILLAVIKNVPLIAKAFEVIIEQILAVIVKEAPNIIAAGLSLLMDLLSGIANNIGRVVETVVTIVVNFLNALAKNMPRIIAAGVNLLTQFLVGVARAAGKIPSIAVKMVVAFVSSLVGSFGPVLSAGASMVGKFISGIAGSIGKVARQGASAISHFVSGIASSAGNLIVAGIHAVGNLLDGIKDGIVRIVQDAAHFAEQVGSAIVHGILNGIKGLATSLANKLKGAVGGALSAVGKYIPGLGGPECMISQPIMQLAADGIDKHSKVLTESIKTNVAKSLENARKSIMDTAGSLLDLNPTVTPVLDLSNVQKNAEKIAGMIPSTTITASVSTTNAASISAIQQAAQQAALESTPTTQPVTEVKFEQNNYSPKALTTVEVYRQTNNQLAQAKTALKIAVPQPSV